MSKQVLFQPCFMKYPEYDKPVRYDENFLKKISEKYQECRLVGEKHYSNKIGTVQNIEYNENGLTGIIHTQKDTTNKKYSPLFEEVDGVDMGDYYLVVDGKLREISLTSNPRQPLNKAHLLNNKDEYKMTKEVKDNINTVLSDNVKELNKKVAMLENQLKVSNEKVEKYDELSKEYEKLQKTVETQNKKLEESKNIVEKYNQYTETKKQELLEKISSGNEEVKKKYEHMDMKDLQLIHETLTNNTVINDKDPKGISVDEAKNAGLNKPVDNNELTLEDIDNALNNAFRDYPMEG